MFFNLFSKESGLVKPSLNAKLLFANKKAVTECILRLGLLGKCCVRKSNDLVVMISIPELGSVVAGGRLAHKQILNDGRQWQTK